MRALEKTKERVSAAFRTAAPPAHSAPPQNPSKKRPSPFCIRLTTEERAYLQQLASNRPLGAYIRERLLGERAMKRRRLRQPKLDDQQYATLLAALGQSRLSSNLNQLARSANMGTLDVSQDIERQLEDAYGAVQEMRKALFIALGLKPEGR